MGRCWERFICKTGNNGGIKKMEQIKLNVLISTLEHQLKQRHFYDKQDIKDIIKILKEILKEQE